MLGGSSGDTGSSSRPLSPNPTQGQSQSSTQAQSQADAERAELTLDFLPKGPELLRDQVSQVVSAAVEATEEQNLAQDMRAALAARTSSTPSGEYSISTICIYAFIMSFKFLAR